MSRLLIDCQNGISSDMLLSALIDLGAPIDLIQNQIDFYFLEKNLEIKVDESNSYGIRGLRLKTEYNNKLKKISRWENLKKSFEVSNIKLSIKNNIIKVYELLAEAESAVHGCKLEDVHFHEVGSFETIANIIGVCTAIDYFDFHEIYSMYPPAGSGNIKTSHGFISIPSPVVLQLSKQNNIKLKSVDFNLSGELTTPSGLALISVISDVFNQPNELDIKNLGTGLGSKDFGFPNILRVIEINYEINGKIDEQILISQETWIDDSSSEDIAVFIDELRNAGAIDVVSSSIQMKKGRHGLNIKAITTQKLAANLRNVWFQKSSTLAVREYRFTRFTLPRRMGICKTSFGEVRVKQSIRPDGSFRFKPEHEDLKRLSLENNNSLEMIRSDFYMNIENFTSHEDWTY